MKQDNELALRPFSILSICSGIGGLELGIKHATGNASRTVCFIEREGYCASVLQARMESGHLDDAPIWSDAKTFDAAAWRGKVDCVTAGYPCQPFSNAGKRRGKEDPRHLWPFIAEHIAAIKPSSVFCENVPGHLALGFEQVCRDLCEMGYQIEAGIFSAQELGAPHRRERMFFLAYADSRLLRQQFKSAGKDVGQTSLLSACNGRQEHVADANSFGRQQRQPMSKVLSRRNEPDGCRPLAPSVANPNSVRQLQQRRSEQEERSGISDGRERAAQCRLDEPADGSSDMVDHIARGWPSNWEDGVPRVTSGQSHRIDRLRALGNAVVPATAALAWKTLWRQTLDAP